MNILAKHFPALQILIPLAGALLATLSFNRFFAWIIAIISMLLSLVLSVYAFQLTKVTTIFYAFGNWSAPIGIEYRLDQLNQPIIIFINAVLLFFLVFGKELINTTITNYIEYGKQHIFYSLLQKWKCTHLFCVFRHSLISSHFIYNQLYSVSKVMGFWGQK